MKYILSVLQRFVEKWVLTRKDDIDVIIEAEKLANEISKGKVSR